MAGQTHFCLFPLLRHNLSKKEILTSIKDSQNTEETLTEDIKGRKISCQ